MSPKPFLPPQSVGGELRAYGREVRAWSVGILARYAIAGVLLVAALASLIGGIAVGVAALFHFLELKYGTAVAYAVIGGLLIVLAILGATLGIVRLRQAPPSPPDPRRHARTASRIAAAESVGAIAASGNALKARLGMPATIGILLVGLLGWLVASRVNKADPDLLRRRRKPRV
jgi:hypothetical protein